MPGNPPEPIPLEELGMSSIWPREDTKFTPWLAENLNQLGEAVGMELELVKREKRLDGAGRLDILAKQAETDALVAIENQFGRSDNDHFARMLGYAAASESDTVIWVANSFSDLHLKVLEWLNRDDTIQFHAVSVQGWKIGKAKGYSIKQVAGPQPGGAVSPGNRAWNWTTACAEFYKPLAQRLRSKAGISMIGRGGFRGRYRTFHAGFKDRTVTYATGLHAEHYGQSVSDRAAVRISGQKLWEVHKRLADLQMVLKQKRGSDDLYWPEISTKHGHAWLGYVKDPSNLQTLKSDPEATRQWMFDRLVTLKEVFQERLDEINAEPVGGQPVLGETDPSASDE